MKQNQLSDIIDYMYYGETNINVEDLNIFLAVAEELELKGLEGPDNKETKEAEPYGEQAQKNYPFLVPKKELHNKVFGLDSKFLETTNECKAVRVTNISPPRTNTAHLELKDKIDSMIETKNGKYSCSICDNFETSKKLNIRNHIEAKHIEGVSHHCNQCGRSFKCKNSLLKHISVQHKPSGHELPGVLTSQSYTVISDNSINL